MAAPQHPALPHCPCIGFPPNHDDPLSQVPHSTLVNATLSILQHPTQWRLTEAELGRWSAFRSALNGWNGTIQALRALADMSMP
jgi:hypothetical protein